MLFIIMQTNNPFFFLSPFFFALQNFSDDVFRDTKPNIYPQRATNLSDGMDLYA